MFPSRSDGDNEMKTCMLPPFPLPPALPSLVVELRSCPRYPFLFPSRSLSQEESVASKGQVIFPRYCTFPTEYFWSIGS